MSYLPLDPILVFLLFLATGAGMAIAPLILSKLLRPNNPSKEKLMPYECGEIPVGEAKLGFEYYAYAALFLIFEIGTVFLFFFVFGKASIIFMYPFLGILLVALYYFMKEKDNISLE